MYACKKWQLEESNQLFLKMFYFPSMECGIYVLIFTLIILFTCPKTIGEMPPMVLLFNNILIAKRVRTMADLYDSKQAKQRLSPPCIQPPESSSLLKKIHDINFYEDLVSIIVQLGVQSGVGYQQLHHFENKLLSAKGICKKGMLIKGEKNIDGQPRRELRQSYKETQKWLNCDEQINLLQQMQKKLIQQRQKQFEYHALRKFVEEKQKHRNISIFAQENTRKQSYKLNYPLKRFTNLQILKTPKQCLNFSRLNVLSPSHQILKKFCKLKTLYGHIEFPIPQDQQYCQVFNVIFDNSQKLIISAAQDGLIKIWSKQTGLLLSNLKGHLSYINKIIVSDCNKYLVSTAGDGIRFFDLNSLKCVGCWSSNCIIEVVAITEQDLKFMFAESKRLYIIKEQNLIIKANDCLEEQDFMIFNLDEINENDNNNILQLVVNKRNRLLLIGFQSGKLIISNYDHLLTHSRTQSFPPLPILSVIQGHSKQIMEIKWHNQLNLFVTSCKGGSCKLWEYTSNHHILHHDIKLSKVSARRKKKQFSCSYVVWNCSYTHIIASYDEILENEDIGDVKEGDVLVYGLEQRAVIFQLSKQLDGMNVGPITSIDAHPIFPNIILVCQYNGKVSIVDIFLKSIVNVFYENGVHLQHPQFLLVPTQCRFSKDGLYFVLGTQFGTISLYGYDISEFYTFCPTEQFLQTDYVPIRLDEKTLQPFNADPQIGEVEIDINCLGRGEVCNSLKVAYQNMLHNDYILYKDNIDHPQRKSRQEHINQFEVSESFKHKLLDKYQQENKRELLFRKTLQQQAENCRSLIVSQNAKYKSIIDSQLTFKIQQLKTLKPSHLCIDGTKMFTKDAQKSQPHQLANSNDYNFGGRRLKKHSQRVTRANWMKEEPKYQDDFDYNSEKQEDFDQKFAEEDPLQSSESYDQEQSEIFARKNRKRNRKSNYREYDQVDQQSATKKRNVLKKKPDDQIKMLEEGYNRIRKKRKINEREDDAQLIYSKKNSSHSIIPQLEGMCQRCKIQYSEVKCTICNTREFCQRCKHYRGKDSPFNCFQCKFSHNSNIQQRSRVSATPYQCTVRDDKNFIPQIGDQVYYFFQGYQEFLSQNIMQLNKKILDEGQQIRRFNLIPHQENQKLIDTPLCKIVAVNYQYPLKQTRQSYDNINGRRGRQEDNKIIQMVLQLQILENEEKVDKQSFWLFYNPNCQFIVRRQVFEEVMNFKDKITINSIVQDNNKQQLQIVDFGYYDPNFPTLWKYLKVRKTEGKRLRASTNNDRKINLWKIQQFLPFQILFKHQIAQDQKQSLLQQLYHIQQSKSNQHLYFQQYVNLQEYPNYSQIVQLGMCLSTIRQRLLNNYYVTIQSLKKDINMIVDNSYKFNGDSINLVTKLAENLSRRLIRILQNQFISQIAQELKQIEKEKQQKNVMSKKLRYPQNKKNHTLSKVIKYQGNSQQQLDVIQNESQYKAESLEKSSIQEELYEIDIPRSKGKNKITRSNRNNNASNGNYKRGIQNFQGVQNVQNVRLTRSRAKP